MCTIHAFSFSFDLDVDRLTLFEIFFLGGCRIFMLWRKAASLILPQVRSIVDTAVIRDGMIRPSAEWGDASIGLLVCETAGNRLRFALVEAA